MAKFHGTTGVSAVTDTRIKAFMQVTGAGSEVACSMLRDSDWDANKAVARYTGFASGAPSTATQIPFTIQENVVTQAACQDETAEHVQISTKPSDAGKLQRGLSKANINIPLVSLARDIMLQDPALTSVGENPENADDFFQDKTEYGFVLPDIMSYPEDMKAFLYKDLIETSMLVSLEQTGRLNWWADIGVCERLLPMVTSGDGNCLLHAASLAMWGFHDRPLALRKALNKVMSGNKLSKAFRRRWRWQQTLTNRQCGLILDEAEWEEDWKLLVRITTLQPRCETRSRSGSRLDRSYAGHSTEAEAVFESLEELHVFVLAHILRRPIIVVANSILRDVYGEALAPIPFGGIYLPLERDPAECYRSPLLLTYDLGHFCALVSMKNNLSMNAAIPLVGLEMELLPIHFAIDPGVDFEENVDRDPYLSLEDKLMLIQQYMEVEQIFTTAHPLSRESPTVRPTWSERKLDLTRTDSEESGLSNGSGSGREDLDRRPKGSKHVQGIAKSFEALATKLKNVAKINKSGKSERRASFVGYVTQCTKTTNFTNDIVLDQNYVLCAKLIHKTAPFHEVYVQNYLLDVQKRFQETKSQWAKQHDELRRRSIEGVQLRAVTRDPHKIPNKIAEKAIDESRISRRPAQLEKLQRAEAVDKPFIRQDTLLTAGKSKFYTDTQEQHCVTPEYSYNSYTVPPTRVKPSMKDRAEMEVISENSREGKQHSVFYSDSASNALSVHRPNRPNSGMVETKLPNGPSSPIPLRVGAMRKPTSRHTTDPAVLQSYSYNKRSQSPPLKKSDFTVGPTEKIVQELWINRDRNDNLPVKPEPVAVQSKSVPCRTENCTYFGTAKTDGLCSVCFQQKDYIPCRSEGCKFPGNRDTEYFCSTCFLNKNYKNQIQYPISETRF